LKILATMDLMRCPRSQAVASLTYSRGSRMLVRLFSSKCRGRRGRLELVFGSFLCWCLLICSGMICMIVFTLAFAQLCRYIFALARTCTLRRTTCTLRRTTCTLRRAISSCFCWSVNGATANQFPFPMSNFPFPMSNFPLPMSNFPLPMSNFPLPMSNFPLPMSHFPCPCDCKQI
jgi:hypothetical protein